jgi:hypothetical protein
MDKGEIRDGDPLVVTATLFGGAIRMIHLRLDGVITKPLPQHSEEVIACLWQGMQPPPQVC